MDAPDVDPRDALSWRRHLGGSPPENLIEVLGAGSIAELLVTLPQRSGGRLRVGERTVRFADLAGLVRVVSSRLGSSIPSGAVGRTLVLMPSSLELVLVYLATVSRGGAVVLANPTSTPAELETLARLSRVDLVVADPELAPKLPELDVEVVAPSDVVGPDGDGPALEADSEDVAILAFTSGTTGTPKAVPLRHRHLLASIRGAAWAWRITDRDHIVHALPLFHQHGLSAVHAALVTGCSLTIAPSFGPDFLRLAQEVDGTIIFAVPAMYQRMVEDERFTAEGLPSLRLAVSGSSALPAALFERIHDRLQSPPLERYGTTESGLNISNPIEGPRVPAAVGLPLPGVEVRLLNESGDEVADGEPGEICVRGPQVFDGYQGDEAATAEATWEGGWFRTGDVGLRSISGSIEIVGRRKELIVTGGMNVYPAEVEAVVAAHPGVREVAVAGRPSERWGEEVVAYVVPGDLDDPLDIVTLCRERLAPYKCPKAVVVVEALPRNAMGKVVRAELDDGTRD